MTQGKEKSRLTQQAKAVEVRKWNTMIVAASNESIFDAVGRGAGASDAGLMRVFELDAKPKHGVDMPSKASVSFLFSQLDDNHGHAGRIYAKWMVENIDRVRSQLSNTLEKLDEKFHMKDGERFWFTIMATLLCGAQFAREAEIAEINYTTLLRYLYRQLQTLRRAGADIMLGTSPSELLTAYLQAHQDRILVVKEWPGKGVSQEQAEVEVMQAPKSDRLIAQVAKKEQRVRVVGHDFRKWLKESHHITWDKAKWEKETNMTAPRAAIGIGTRWALPRAYLLEFDYDTGEFNEGDS